MLPFTVYLTCKLQLENVAEFFWQFLHGYRAVNQTLLRQLELLSRLVLAVDALTEMHSCFILRLYRHQIKWNENQFVNFAGRFSVLKHNSKAVVNFCMFNTMILNVGIDGDNFSL